jgi:hypothetical protein
MGGLININIAGWKSTKVHEQVIRLYLGRGKMNLIS